MIDQLLERFEIQCRKQVRNYPFLMGQGVWIDSDKLGPDDEVREVLKHGTLTVGFIGLAEAPQGADRRAPRRKPKRRRTWAWRSSAICAAAWTRQARNTGLNFSLIATPAEGLSGRFVAHRHGSNSASSPA